MKAYSAGLMSQSFWFIEFKKVVKLVSDGKSQNDIKAACVEENLLGAVNPYRAKRVAGYSHRSEYVPFYAGQAVRKE